MRHAILILDMPDGFLLINKPHSLTSFQVCADVRQLLGVQKVGHTGTLDPFATGLLLVALGTATRYIPFLEANTKTYTTTIKLGATTATLDPMTPESAVTGPVPTAQQVEEVARQFVGDIQQVPPQHSAIHIDGVRAYELARQGKHFSIPARQTTIHSLTINSYSYPFIEIQLTVAAGFYVRSFARDLGTELGSAAYCTKLTRTAISNWDLTQAVTLAAIEETATQSLLPIETVVPLPKIIITGEIEKRFRHGQRIPTHYKPGKYLVCTAELHCIGMAEISDGVIRPRIVH